jgi:hypothetical protein
MPGTQAHLEKARGRGGRLAPETGKIYFWVQLSAIKSN